MITLIIYLSIGLLQAFTIWIAWGIQGWQELLYITLLWPYLWLQVIITPFRDVAKMVADNKTLAIKLVIVQIAIFVIIRLLLK